MSGMNYSVMDDCDFLEQERQDRLKSGQAEWTRLRTEHADLTAKLKLAERLFAEATVIEGKEWSISNNGNPAKLIALRQFDNDGNVMSYTHHDSVLEAFTALKQIGEQR